MVDNLTPQDPGPAAAPAPEAGAAKPGFMSSTLGKVVVIGGAVVAFLVVAGLVVFAVMTFVLVDTVNEAGQAIVTGIEDTSSGVTGSSSTTTAVATEPDEVPLSSIFTFRDIFDPLMKPAPAEEDTSTATDGTDVVTEPDTVYLQDIVVENGVSMAVLLYNNNSYSLPAGGVIPDTPWQVLSVGSDSVVMLYGDSQVTLVVGQGVSTK